MGPEESDGMMLASKWSFHGLSPMSPKGGQVELRTESFTSWVMVPWEAG